MQQFIETVDKIFFENLKKKVVIEYHIYTKICNFVQLLIFIWPKK